MKQSAMVSSCQAVWLGVLMFFVSGVTMATEWSIEPSVSLKEEYNDNINMTMVSQKAVWHTWFSPSVAFSSRSESVQVSGNARVNFNKYSGNQGLEDKTDQIFGLSSSWQAERNTWSLNASYTLDPTQASELQQTGYVLTRKQRRSTSLSPSWATSLTERLNLSIGYSYTDVEYDKAPGLTDNTYQKLSSTLSYSWSEQDKVFLVVSSDKLENASSTYSTTPQFDGYFIFIPMYKYGGQDIISGDNSKTQNVMLGLDHAFSESLSGSLQLGRRSTRSSAVHTCNGDISVPVCTYNDNSWVVDPLITFAKTNSSSGSTFNASLRQQIEAGQVSATASRGVNTSGAGLLETDTLGISANHSFSETLSGSVGLTLYRTRYLGENVNNSNSRYFSFSPSLSWRVTEWWQLNAGYRYAKSKADNTSLAAASNMAFVEVAYNWPKMSVSR